MGRPFGTKNIMRTPKEKEQIVIQCLTGTTPIIGVAKNNSISRGLLTSWIKVYREKGITGLESKTGKHANPKLGKYNRNMSEVEKLKQDLLKKEIEIARLKKGYQVKGVGAKKEYITIFEENTK